MKRFLTFIVSLCICLYSAAQIQITTKKEKLSDFPMKTTKVVLTGDQLMDQYLKTAMKNTWVLSPFEFCNEEEFNSLKSSQDYYFMALDEPESAPGIVQLNIVKGGTGSELKDMLNVVSFPICAADSSYQRLDAFLPAIVQLMQNHVKRGLYNNFRKISPHALTRVDQKIILLAENDLNDHISRSYLKKLSEEKDMVTTDTRNADQLFIEGADALVSYSFSSPAAGKKAVCYKMLFDAKTYDLYYYRTHSLTSRRGKGFLQSDLQKIAHSR